MNRHDKQKIFQQYISVPSHEPWLKYVENVEAAVEMLFSVLEEEQIDAVLAGLKKAGGFHN